MPFDYYIAIGDSGDVLEANLKEPDGSPVNLTGATVEGRLKHADAKYHIVLSPVNVVNALTGDIEYVTAAGKITRPGLYNGKWVVSFPNGAVRSYPNSEYFSLFATDDL